MKEFKNFKRMMTLVVMVLFSIISVFAQTVKTHVVERGETLASIAEKYSVTKEDIVKLNPDAAQFIYVGMELKIPEGGNALPKNPNSFNAEKVMLNNQQTKENDAVNYGEESKWSACFELGYGFLPKLEGVSGSNYAYRATFGFNYAIKDGLYAGARIGYNSSNVYSYIHTSGNSVSGEYNCHFLCIPSEIGYNIPFDEQFKFGIIPFAGLDFNIGLSGKSKIKENKETKKENIKIGGKIAVGARVGVCLKLWDWCIIGSYVLPVNDKQKEFFTDKAYPEICIGCRI